MKKAQTYMIEFVLFFGIAFGLFGIISFFYLNQTNYFQRFISKYSSELIGDVIASEVVSGLNCKSCDTVIIAKEIPNKLGGFSYVIQTDGTGVTTNVLTETATLTQNPLFNLNSSFSISNNIVKSENKKIEITINNIGKIIKVE